jgi:3-hydroxypropanoate dehydrogenase
MADTSINDQAQDLLFRAARSHNAWMNQAVDPSILTELYELMKWGPTSANGAPARFVFLCTPEAKEKLRPALAPTNVEKAMTAPVVVIVAQSLNFYEKLPSLMPHAPMMREYFAGNDPLSVETAFRNSSLQGAYMMIAARALGLDCGPMSGFDNAKVDETFFSGGLFSNEVVKSNFIFGMGYGNAAKLFPRNPRLAFEEACAIA